MTSGLKAPMAWFRSSARTLLRRASVKCTIPQQRLRYVHDNTPYDGKIDRKMQANKWGRTRDLQAAGPNSHLRNRSAMESAMESAMIVMDERAGDTMLDQDDATEEWSSRLSKPVLPDLSRPAPVILPFEDKQASDPWKDSAKIPSNTNVPVKKISSGMLSSEKGALLHWKPVIHGVGSIQPTVIDSVGKLLYRRQRTALRGTVVGFVPTMGALHEGHLDLMRAAAKKCQEVWVSIYVNPTQFGANEDLSTYPSTWTDDLAKIESLNEELMSQELCQVRVVFRPTAPEELYPYGIEGTSHVIINPELTQILEGASRPTFFRGVTTVVMKLLNIVQPDYVFFGQKDIQQFAVIKRMIKEFHIQTRIQRVPTTREDSGLAMSSRNAYLGHRRRTAATILYKMLSKAKTVFEETSPEQRTRKLLIDAAMGVFNMEKTALEKLEVVEPHRMVKYRLDYLSLAHPDTLQEIQDAVGQQGAIMSLAIYFEPLDRAHIKNSESLGINNDTTTVRLIDNMLLGVQDEKLK